MNPANPTSLLHCTRKHEGKQHLVIAGNSFYALRLVRRFAQARHFPRSKKGCSFLKRWSYRTVRTMPSSRRRQTEALARFIDCIVKASSERTLSIEVGIVRSC